MEDNMKNKLADHTTWCDDKMLAGVKLAKILNDIGDLTLINNVNTIISKYDRRLKALLKINNNINVHQEYFALLVMKDMKQLVISTNYPTSVETHLLNLMTAKYRKVLKIGKHKK